MTSPRRARGIIISAVATTAVTLGGVGLASTPALAAVSGFGGPVGVPETIVVTNVTPAGFGQETCTMVPVINSVTQTSVTGALVNGTATFSWTPQSPGAATFSMVDCSIPTPYPAATIGQVSTTTQITTPNTATVGKPTQIYVLVQSTSPSTYSPTGQVVVKNANGAVLQTMGLTPGPGTGQSYAYYWWTPTQAGTYYFQATYNGSASASVSTSPLDTIIATPSGGTISISAPSTMTQGQPVTLTATVFPAGTQGSVGFTVNGAPISASIPINANGQASFLWTPNVAGQITLGASYTTNQGGSGSTSEQVTVNPGPVQKDVITLVQPGWGPWNPNGTYTLGNGSSFAFQATTLSGSGVTLTETGPCQVSGLTIVIPTGSGQCNLVATSPGGNGYAGVQYGYTVSLIPGNQTATLAAPQSGNVNVGKTLTLESPAQQDTNAGQNITWKITKGKNSVCKLTFPSSGAVKLKIVKKGQCNVKGSAAGVAGQWNPYTVTRSYRGV